MKEKRRYERFSVQLPLNLKLLTSSRTRRLDVETKDISASGAFIYTKDASYIPDDTRFLIASSYAHIRNIELKKETFGKLCRDYGTRNVRRYSGSF